MTPTVQLRAIRRPGDDTAIIDFLSSQTFPFHVYPTLSADDARRRLERGDLDGPDHAAYWVVAGTERVGLTVLDDLEDETPLFDLRLADHVRGRGLGVLALRALTDEVFKHFPDARRFEGQTRADNIAMRRTFLAAGWVKEAHYREAWPTRDGDPRDAVAYAILRRDWTAGTSTPVPWDDEPDRRIESRSGRIIVLSGASGTGKTMLARRLRDQLGKGWLHIEADDFAPTFAPGGGPDDGAGLPAFVRAMLDAALRWPERGFDTIIDGLLPFPSDAEDVLYQECVRRLREARAVMVGVRADPDDVGRRITSRGRGDVEWSRHQLATMHRLGKMDAWINTSGDPDVVTAALDSVIEQVGGGPVPTPIA